jgi:hypothetical protein
MPTPTAEEIRALADEYGIPYVRLGDLTESSARSAQEWVSTTTRRRMHPGLWALLRARAALLADDEAQALAVLRETL